MKRLLLIVMDSLGVGAMPDAKAFGDSEKVHTLANVCTYNAMPMQLPSLDMLGLMAFRHERVSYEGPAITMKLPEASMGKDTVVGHWELMGVISDEAFPVYPNGFPREVTALVAQVFGKEPIGNLPMSGTKIIEELGEEHLASGAPILYTSSDSVLQIAYSEDLMPASELHSKCAQIRQALLKGPHRANRVIARPFIGRRKGEFQRTSRRKDFTIPIPENNLLHDLLAEGIPVHAFGKIQDIFPNVPFTTADKFPDNQAHMKALMEACKQDTRGLLFANLLDFDMLYGHRRNRKGYAKCLQAFDRQLGELMDYMNEDDGLILVADHGCDPTAPGSDHTREYVPLIYFEKGEEFGGYQGIGQCFADCAASIADLYGIDWKDRPGRSIFRNGGEEIA